MIDGLEETAADAPRLGADEQDGLSEESVQHAAGAERDGERHVGRSDARLEGDRVRGVDDDDNIVVRGAGVLWALQGVGAQQPDDDD